MEYSIFADESGTDPSMKCYSIGTLAIPNSRLVKFEEWFRDLKVRHGVPTEVKWKKVKKTHGLINLGIELFSTILKAKLELGFIVVKKSAYRNWQENKERAFYKSYTMLLHQRMKASAHPHEVYIDDKDDSYPKHDEAMQIIATNMLKNIKAKSSIKFVKKSDSKLMAGIQAIDLLTGAINSSHNLYLDPNWKQHGGKDILIKKLASIIGWDDLKYDTFPHLSPNPNIWQFPKEYRDNPESKNVTYNHKYDFITLNDLKGLSNG